MSINKWINKYIHTIEYYSVVEMDYENMKLWLISWALC